MSESYNAMYYKADAIADRVIYYDSNMSVDSAENVQNWSYDAQTKRLTYNWPEGEDSETARRNVIELDGEALLENDVVVVSTAGTGLSVGYDGVYVAKKLQTHDLDTGALITNTYLEKMSGIASATVVKGATFHNTFWYYDNKSSSSSYKRLIQGDEAQWVQLVKDTRYSDDRAKESYVALFDIHNNNYKWEVTLYQGNYNEYPTSTNTDGELMPSYVTYSDVDTEWLDMTVMQGTILGSTPERI
jgi:hypothetical protein